MNFFFKNFGTTATSVILFAGLTGCSSGPALENYPERVIDRPFTLPVGVASFSADVEGYTYGTSNPNSYTPVYANFFWQLALSEDWNLILAPFDIGAKFQILKTESQLLGLNFGTEMFYSSTSGMGFEPTLALDHRVNFTKSYAVKSRARYQTQVSSGSYNNTWLASAQTGPLVQISTSSSFWFSLGYSLDYSFAFQPLNDYRTITISSSTPNNFTTRTSFPLELDYIFNASRNWDLTASYKFNGIGARSEDVFQALDLGFAFYW